jgi:hypothetical protein
MRSGFAEFMKELIQARHAVSADDGSPSLIGSAGLRQHGLGRHSRMAAQPVFENIE